MKQQPPANGNGTVRPDDLELHCPRLGHLIRFAYCLHPGEDTPCFKIVDCWWQTFDVVAYLKAHLDPETFSRLCEERAPPNRMSSILEIVDRIRKDKEPG